MNISTGSDIIIDQLDASGIETESLSSSGQDESLLVATPVPEENPLTSVDGLQDEGEDIVDDVTGNGQSEAEGALVPLAPLLPWGSRKERSTYPPGIHIDADLKPGEFIMRTLFAQFTGMVDKKIEAVMTEPLEKPLSKSLQLGEDLSFDQLLTAFGTVAEHCLPSMLRTLFAWYDKQLEGRVNIPGRVRTDSKSKSSTMSDMPGSMEEELMHERRDLAVEFVFCLVLIEVLKQLSVHPGHDDLILYIENVAFRHFKYKEGLVNSPNYSNHLKIADLYGEVIGVLAQSRFHCVRKRFSQELKELRLREATQPIAQSIISLLMGMKFFRVKMVPIEEFEASLMFLQECGTYFLEVKDKDIKHSLAGLFVDILTPLAAVVKNEVNVPCLKNFVESLYPPTLDLCTKNKHKLALFPLVTCLLCVSQKSFFIQNFHYFLAMVLSNLKNKDPQMARVGLESLFRLIWVYMVRIKQPESNQSTTTRLHSIINSLFPKGSKTIVPRDAPPYIFVRIIQYIATEKLEFAMREIIFDLLQVGRTPKIILTPERMNIGLRAFLVIADSLQKKEGDPPMPQHVGSMPSGNTLRIKKTYLNKVLTDDTAKSIGINAFYPHVRKVLSGILRALDSQFGKPLLLTNNATANKEPDELIQREHKPKIDLFRACLAAVPRVIPDGMSRSELIDLLSRLTLHVDEELQTLALQSLQNIVTEFAEWREDAIYGFVQFIIRDIPDTTPQLLDSGLRGLLQLVTTWRTVVSSGTSSNPNTSLRSVRETIEEKSELTSKLDPATVLHMTEAFCLVTFCQCRLAPRRISVLILKEVKQILKGLHLTTRFDEPVLDVMDKCCPEILEKCASMLPSSERAAVNSALTDLQWIAERNSAIWTAGSHDENAVKTVSTQNLSGADPWATCLLSFLETDRLLTRSVSAVHHAWPIVHSRLSTIYSAVDPSPISENRASLLRSATAVKRPTNERDGYVRLWKNYIAFACRVVPRIQPPVSLRPVSPDTSLGSSPESYSSERHETRTIAGNPSSSLLHKLLIPLVRCEVNDMREATISALGMINHEALRDVMDELLIPVRDAVDRKSANMRRQKRRDVLRLHLVKIFQLIAERGTFAQSDLHLPTSNDGGHLPSTCVEFIDGMRQCLENDVEKDSPSGKEVRIAYADFVQKLITSFPLDSRGSLLKRDLLRQMFNLFSQWSPNFSRGLATKSTMRASELPRYIEELEFCALRAMCSVLACGPVYDQQVLAEDAPLFSWMDLLLSSRDQRVNKLGKDTVVLLLEFNQDSPALLEWVVNRCYTGEPPVSDGCFHGLATIFTAKPEYPAGNHIAIMNVTLLMTGCPRPDVQDVALQLLPLLDRQFFGAKPPLTEEEAEDHPEEGDGLDSVLAASYSRSQIILSKHLSDIRADLTMRLFSEIMYRLETARHSVRQQLLEYLLPWLSNMELVDPHLPPGSIADSFQAEQVPKGCSREAWGSVEATEMVLTNLLYVTARFGDNHAKEVELLWAELSSSFPVNLKVILRYLFIMASLSPHELFRYAKLVCLYLGRARPERLLDELMNELQTVESASSIVERTSTPPYYRTINTRKTSNCWDTSNGASGNLNGNSADAAETDRVDNALSVEKGTIHTKRRSAEDPGKDSFIETGTVRSTITYLTSLASGQGSLHGPPGREGKSSPRLDRSRSTPATPAPMEDQSHPYSTRKLVSVDESVVILRNSEVEFYEVSQPRPIPMPEYGGYYGHLTDFLPETSQPVAAFQRYNLALVFINDLVVDGLEGVDWAAHLPLILHMAILGLDNSRALIAESCRNILISLLIALTEHNDYSSVGKILLKNRAAYTGLKLVLPKAPVVRVDFTDPSLDVDSTISESVPIHISDVVNEEDGPDEQKDECVVAALELQKRLSEIVKSLVDFISSKSGQALWSYEDITSRTWSVQSAKQLETFVQNISRVFSDSQPHTILEERWAQFALNLALSSPSRHYAGRSLQVFRALRIPVSLRMISDILSRLVETVSEQGEDMQGYVTELILTLESSVDSLDTDFRPIDMARDIFKSTPNLHKEMLGPKKQYSGVAGKLYGGWRDPTGHIRSTSYSVAYNSRRIGGSPAVDRRDFQRNRSSTDCEVRNRGSNMFRSRSATSLKGLGDPTSQEDKLTILAQLFWIGVSLLQSDFEHEFLLALKLLQKVLEKFPLGRPDCRDKVEKLLVSLKWTHFPGVHSLLLKGLTNTNTYEQTVSTLSSFTKLLNVSVIDPSGGSAFAFNVMALLPYMLAHYEDANELCVRSAEHIAQVSTDISQKLENLATVMTLYSRRTFSKESFQWTKCVVKYLCDSFSTLTLPIMSFIVELLEKGPSMVHLPCMTILHSLLHYVDVSSSSTSHQINTDLMRVIAKHVEGPYWKDALKIAKLIVTRSSSLVAPAYGESSSITGPFSLDSDIFLRKELPGRTMEFSYDLSQTPVIGRKAEGGKTQEQVEKRPGHVSPRRSVSLGSADGSSASGWKRPWLCQTRVRESLVNLLTSCGQKVGLPKSPSVIFSQGSDPLERQSSLASSMDEVSGQGNDHSGDSKLDDSIATEQQLRVFKDFDFLEYELESSEGEGRDQFNWGVQRHSLSSLDVDNAGREHFRDSMSASDGTHRSNDQLGLEESSDEEVGSVSPMDEIAPDNSRPIPNTLAMGSEDTSGHHSDSSHDECSEGDGGDLTPCNVSPSVHLIPSGTFRPIGSPASGPLGLASGECDAEWKRQIQGLQCGVSVTPELVLDTLRVFGKLFKEARVRISSYIQECNEILSSIDTSGGRLSIFPLMVEPVATFVEVINRQFNTPYIYCDVAVLTGSRLLDRLKFGLLELNEHYELCVDRKEHLIESFNIVQSTLGTSLGSSFTEVPYEDQFLDIGKHSHKLLFQCLMLFEAYVKVLGLLRSATKRSAGVDLTSEVELVHEGLTASVEEDDVDQESEPDNEMTRPQAEFTLIELIINKRYTKAMKHVWQYRYLWPAGRFGQSVEEETHAILDIFCKYQSDKKGGAIFALHFVGEKLEELCGQLMDSVLKIQSTLKSDEQREITEC